MPDFFNTPQAVPILWSHDAQIRMRSCIQSESGAVVDVEQTSGIGKLSLFSNRNLGLTDFASGFFGSAIGFSNLAPHAHVNGHTRTTRFFDGQLSQRCIVGFPLDGYIAQQ